jgi:hypothetical protein
MRPIRWLPLLFLPLVVLSPRAHAQCVGFNDVAGNPFLNLTCQNVAWVKNRSITLGCAPSLYCPLDSVNRLQMAAFMNRVGNVLTPNVQSVEQSGGTLTLSQSPVICQTPELPALSPAYPRTVDVAASLSFEVNTFQSQLVVWPAVSKNGGAFQVMGGQSSQSAANAGVRYNTGAAISAYVLPNNPATTVKFGLLVTSLVSPGVITGYTCHLQATLRNAIYALEF